MSLWKSSRISLLLCLLGVCFLAIGVWQEETEQIYRKAVNICMECIGLG